MTVSSRMTARYWTLLIKECEHRCEVASGPCCSRDALKPEAVIVRDGEHWSVAVGFVASSMVLLVQHWLFAIMVDFGPW